MVRAWGVRFHLGSFGSFGSAVGFILARTGGRRFHRGTFDSFGRALRVVELMIGYIRAYPHPGIIFSQCVNSFAGRWIYLGVHSGAPWRWLGSIRLPMGSIGCVLRFTPKASPNEPNGPE